MKFFCQNSAQQKHKGVSQDRIYLGIFYACIAFFCFAVMGAMNKLLTGQHHVVEIAFYRNMLGLIPCFIYIAMKKNINLVKTDMPRAMGLRAIIGTIGLLLTFAAIQALPISNATVLFFVSTLLTPVLAYFLLREHVGPHRWAAILIGFIGVILVAGPSAELTLIGVILALGAAICHASIQVLIRAMKSQNPFTITFYFFLGGFILPGLFMPWFATMPTAQSALILLGIGVFGGFGQVFLTLGFQSAPASLLSPFNYTGLLWAVIFDVMIWSIIPGWPVFTGAAIIICANLYIIYRERLKGKKAKEIRQI